MVGVGKGSDSIGTYPGTLRRGVAHLGRRSYWLTGRPSGVDFRASSRMIPSRQQIHLFGTERGTTADARDQRCKIRGQDAWVHDSSGESSGWAKASGTPKEASKARRLEGGPELQ